MEKKSQVMKSTESRKRGMKRFSLTSDDKGNHQTQGIILNPIKSVPSADVGSSPVQLKLVTTQRYVRRSMLRQFDPLMEEFTENDERRQNAMSNSFIIAKFQENELSNIKLQDDVDQEHPRMDISTNSSSTSVNSIYLDKGTIPSTSCVDEWSRLSTIEETSTEDLTVNSSAIAISCIASKTCVNNQATDLLGKFPQDAYEQPSENIVDATSSCSSCSSYTTSCSTLEEFVNTPPPPPPYHEDPIWAQHYLHQELSLENELCIEKLKMVYETNKDTKALNKTYEKHFEEKTVELEGAQISHSQMKNLLAIGEDAFSKLHSKYNKAKNVIDDYHKNECEIKKTIDENEIVSRMCKEKYELLNDHGKMKLSEFKKAAMEESKMFEKELKMMQAAVKHLQIKVSSLEQQLAQKCTECLELSNLYVEMTIN